MGLSRKGDEMGIVLITVLDEDLGEDAAVDEDVEEDDV